MEPAHNYILFAVLIFLIFAFWLARRTGTRKLSEAAVVVSFDGEKISVLYPDESEKHIAWADITQIGIRTTGDGPWAPDVFWGFHDQSGPVLVFPGGATGEKELLVELQTRYPDFDNMQFVMAMSVTDDAYFPLWQKEK